MWWLGNKETRRTWWKELRRLNEGLECNTPRGTKLGRLKTEHWETREKKVLGNN